MAIAAVAAFLLAFNVIAWTGSMGTTTSSATTSSQTADEPAAITTQQS